MDLPDNSQDAVDEYLSACLSEKSTKDTFLARVMVMNQNMAALGDKAYEFKFEDDDILTTADEIHILYEDDAGQDPEVTYFKEAMELPNTIRNSAVVAYASNFVDMTLEATVSRFAELLPMDILSTSMGDSNCSIANIGEAAQAFYNASLMGPHIATAAKYFGKVKKGAATVAATWESEEALRLYILIKEQVPEASFRLRIGIFCKTPTSTEWTSKSKVDGLLGVMLVMSQVASVFAYLEKHFLKCTLSF